MVDNKSTKDVFYRQSLAWSKRFNAVRGEPLTSFVSAFRDGMPCKVVENMYGTGNLCVRMCFEDGVEWVARFGVAGLLMIDLEDRKVRHEVATMQFVREKTRIPVPEVFAWGAAKDNPLGLGAFIVMQFVPGKRLGRMLEVAPDLPEGKLLRTDLSDESLNYVYRQIANFMLDLSEHSLPHIGSISMMDNAFVVDADPLMRKMNDIEKRHSYKTYTKNSEPMNSTTAMFELNLARDLDYLNTQENPVRSVTDARQKYTQLRTYQALAQRMIDKDHDKGPFKLICEGFRPGNMLADENLKITAVIDWEWAYAAPYQLLYSPPRWLIGRQPVVWSLKPPFLEACESWYRTCFDRFHMILEQEEVKRPVNEPSIAERKAETMSSLMRQSYYDGKWIFHEAMRNRSGFEDKNLYDMLRQFIPDLDHIVNISEDEMTAFVLKKSKDLSNHDNDFVDSQDGSEGGSKKYMKMKELVNQG